MVRLRRLALSALLAELACTAAVAAAATPASAPANDRPIPLTLRAERAQAMYQVQGGATVDHPIGEALVLGGERFPARVTDQGHLEIDLARDGKPKPVRPGPLTVTLGKPEDKRRAKLEIYVVHGADQTWTYRTITQLSGQLGDEPIAVIDVDGDGVFNEPGVDGISLGGRDYAFPLPAGDEHWCTGKLIVTGLSFGAMGEQPKLVGRPLATTVSDTLAELLAINVERLKVGLTPRPENPALSAPLQKHCKYLVTLGKLSHPEEPGKAGYSPEGHEAGMNSILGMGRPPEGVAANMVATFYHRQDVVRPDTRAFGVGYEGTMAGIDGRRDLGARATWPILVPAPDQSEVPTHFNQENPDPIGGDQAAGYPITVYFGSGGLRLTAWKLEQLDKAGPKAVDCYVFDSTKGGNVQFNGYQRVVGLIAKEPLADAAVYRVSMTVDGAGGAWTKTWQFSTVGAKLPR
jgi:hypothetical protein